MSQKKLELSLPVSIIISGIIIAMSIIFTRNNGEIVKQAQGINDPNAQVAQDKANLDAINKVKKDEHIRGNIDAPVTIVEYSDLECPFCTKVHATIKAVVAEYDGDVAWVYRQFPLTNLQQNFHVNAVRAANATECIANMAGNEAFWNFIDGLFEGGKPLSDSLYQSLAQKEGVDMEEFQKCVDESKYQNDIDEDINNAFEIGGGGTPWIVVLGPNGEKLPIEGAQPISVFRSIITPLIESE